jgi:ech hydrogenase subunit A
MNEVVGILPILVPLIGGIVSFLAYKAGRTSGAVIVIMSAIALIAVGPAIILLGADTVGLEHELFAGLDAVDLLDYVLIIGFIVMAVMIRRVGWKAYLALGLAVAQLAAVAYFDFSLKGSLVHPEHNLNIDGLSHIFLLISSLVGGAILIYATKYMEDEHNHPRFFFVMFLFIASMNGAVFSDNLMWLFFFWEMTTLCSFLLINHEGSDESLDSASTALWMTMLGGLLLIIGIIVVAMEFDTFSMATLLAESPVGGIAFLAVSLFALAAFSKSAIYPFQKWLIRAMVAPTPVSALLHSATMVNLGIYLLLRVTPTFSQSDALQIALTVAGGFTFLFGALQALPQEDAKKMLAYSTISNLGLIVLSIGISSAIAYIAALMLLFFHAFAKAMLFMSVGIVYKRTHTRVFDRMSGMFTRMPSIAVLIYIGVLALMALPFGAFVTKWILLEQAKSAPILIPFVVLGTSVSVFVYTQWLGRISTGIRKKRVSVSPIFTWPLYGLAFAIVISSLFIAGMAREVLTPALPFTDKGDVGGIGTLDIMTVTGFYSTIPLFVVLILSIIVPIIFLSSGRRHKVGPYTGGGKLHSSFRGFYFKEWLDDSKLDKPLIGLSVLIAISIIVVGVIG